METLTKLIPIIEFYNDILIFNQLGNLFDKKGCYILIQPKRNVLISDIFKDLIKYEVDFMVCNDVNNTISIQITIIPKTI